MIELVNVSKSYGGYSAIKGINLKIDKGSLFGLIGPNGAGKTTLLNCILNNLGYEGEIFIDGELNSKFLKKYRKEIVYIPESIFVYEYLTGIEFVHFIFDMKGIPFVTIENKLKLLFELFELSDFQNRLIREYSQGMKRKLSLIAGLAQTPKIFILDEPILGIDTKSIIVFKKLLKSFSTNDVTTIITTHIIDLLKNMCDTIAIVNNKKIVFKRSLSELKTEKLEQIYLDTIGGELDFSIKLFNNLLSS